MLRLSRGIVSKSRCFFSSEVSVEDKIKSILKLEFEPTFAEVKDVSGGCGAMFDISVESHKFKGKSLVAQHKMVTKVLSSEIKDMHGLTLKTSISDR
mmetsp:Transcript_25645/g.24503  ORF Transcript_25645/g.24503 Transcript_25645/m.24503 type:complete len:97 (-) Transcript_25645:120-410(-)